jgi:DAACS family dicarboxylate/amino acid:cation (Na+ or H+) symporter
VLLTVDWFLDRCRTAVNVSGDMTVAVLIDRPRNASV